jgi:hypothetical protein
MTLSAKGIFQTEMQPLPEDEGWGDFSRSSIDKQFSGEITGASRGVMLASYGEFKGSAGYVALERVTAELDGRTGSFVLQHSGIMGQGAESLDVTVVTDSGTDELTGIAGSMELIFEKEGPSYVLSYSMSSAG